MSLEDLIPIYPSLDGNDSQLVLYQLAEFNVLEASKEVEKRAKPGDYYKHQLVRSRILYLRDRIFFTDEPGTGKSCSITVSNESFKDSTNIFKKFYLVVYTSLTDSMRNQVICKCTNNKYINDEGRSGATKSQVKMSGRESFKSNYELISYDEIYKSVKGKTSKQLMDEFNYCVFSFDEVTILVTLKFTSVIKKNNPNGTITWDERVSKSEILMLSTITDLDDPRIINSDIEYVQMWRLLHSIPNSKVIFASGTPIMNRCLELLILCNLLLPLNNQINLEEFGRNIFYYNLKKFAPYFNGLFAYVKSSNVVARPNYIGKKLDKKYLVEYPMDDTSDFPQIGIKQYSSQHILYRVELFGYQANKIYKNKKEIFSEQIASKTEQFLCYVDFKEKTGVEANNDEYNLNYLGQPGINGLNMRMNSCSMYSEIYRIELNALLNARKNGKPGPGVCFNYMNLTESGIGSLRKLFQSSGIFEVMEDFTFLKQMGGDYCSIGVLSFRGLIKRPRAVFLTGDINPSLRDKIIQLAGSPDNIHGEYIQFIDGSSVMGIGVNIKNGKRFIRPLPEWNEAKDKQSRDRVFRDDGHDEIREDMANDILAKTGVRPNPYDLDVFVDVYNMCAFVRFFYIDTKEVKKFIPSMNIKSKHPFNMDLDLSGNKTITVENTGEKLSMLIGHMNIVHLVGFCEHDLAKSIHHKQIMEYCIIGDIPHVEIAKRLKVDISSDLLNLTIDHMDIILCISGILYVSPLNNEIKNFIADKILMYHNDCDFMKVYRNRFYRGECYAILLKSSKADTDKTEKVEPPKPELKSIFAKLLSAPIPAPPPAPPAPIFASIPTPAVLDVDYEMIPVDMLYISPSENQYIQLEEKSFGSRRYLRMTKRFASDCINQHERTYNTNDVDGSLECDYDNCEYTCSSNVLTGETTENFMYNGGGIIWNNYEVLYSGLIIKQCKETIIKMFNGKTKIQISEIFDRLIPICNREYFINMAIYELISNKVRLKDSFGFSVYISGNDTELFLMRDFPKSIKNKVDNTGDYVKKLIAVSSEFDYRKFFTIDDGIIDEIESIYIDPNNPIFLDPRPDAPKFENLIVTAITNKIKMLKMYPSNFMLIERCFGRIAYNRIVDEKLRNPEYAEKQVDSFVIENIYTIRCFMSNNIDGTKTFFHNQPKINVMMRQGEITKLIKASDQFRIFYIQNGKPAWRNASKLENEKLSEIATADINERINNQLTKIIPVQMSDGTIQNIQFNSLYYISYYEGTYRLTNRTKGTGEDLASLKNSTLQTFVTWLEQTPMVYLPGNYQAIMTMKGLISGHSIKKKERNDFLIKFFRDNDLIFSFSIEDIIIHN